MISTEPIESFNKSFDMVSLFVICGGKILLLRRREGKLQGNAWGPVAGKVEGGETPKEAVLRETLEETGVSLKSKQIIKYEKNYFARHGDTDFIFYVFVVELDKYPDVYLSAAEYSEYDWFTPQEALALELVVDEEVPIADYFFGGEL